MKFFASALMVGLAAVSLSSPASAADPESLAVGRCDIPAAAPVFTRLVGGLPSEWSVESPEASRRDPLPELMVDGWTPGSGPADSLIKELLNEAGINHVGSLGLTSVSWDGSAAPISKVVDHLVSQAGGEWSYDGSTLRLLDTPRPKVATASFQAPSDRDVRLATIDILRGFDVSVTATPSAISVSGSTAEVNKAREALRSTKSITVYDVLFLRGRPDSGRYEWSSLGASSAAVSGAGGDFVFQAMEPEDLVTKLAEAGDLVEDSAQSVAAPDGWSLAVPPAQCGQGPGELMVGMKGDVSSPSLSLSGLGVETQFANFNLGDALVGAASVPENGWIRMVVVRPRVVQFSLR